MILRLFASRVHPFFSRPKGFHTSRAHRVLPPYVVLFMKPLSRVGAFVIGKTLKRLWRNLPKEQKDKVKELLTRHNTKVGALAGLLSLSGAMAYRSHLEVNPISKKEYLMILNHDQMRKVSQKQFEELIEGHRDNILKAPHPAYERVVRVVTRLLEGNRDLTDVPKLNWTISVVHNEEINAFVLQNGNIFVHTGMLRSCQNDDQLAIVLSHEIAHVLLYHVEAKLSYASLISLLLLVPLATIWAMMPNDGIALVSNWFIERVSTLMMELPFSRDMEKEADEIGLLMAAKSCFDTREGPVFWGRMALREKLEHKDPESEALFSTHPTSESREAHMDSILQDTLSLRCATGCPPLSREDPRVHLRRLEMRLGMR